MAPIQSSLGQLVASKIAGGIGRVPRPSKQGVALYRWISGLFVRRLTGADGQFLRGADGRPLYGRTE